MINSVGFHRLFSHGAFKTSSFWEKFLLLSGTLTCYGSSIQWAVVHTEHHIHSDTDLDPHQFNSFWNIFKPNYIVKSSSWASRKVIARLLKKPWHSFFHKYYWAFGIGASITILLVFGIKALLFLYWAPIGLTIFGGAFFNYISHDKDGPTNKAVWALQASGEWRHKLHHNEPTRWDLREAWWHLDPSAYFIKAIKQ
jgi:stearoyl-CoA desaturase (delta-9 desaturase)